MSAAPSWPLIFAALAGETFRSATAIAPRVEFRIASKEPSPNPGIKSSIRSSDLPNAKRRAGRTTHPPVQTSRFTDWKSPKFDCLPTASAGSLLPPAANRVFSAASPIWDGNRGDSRVKSTDPHTFLCTPSTAATCRTHFACPPEARPRPCRPGAVQLAHRTRDGRLDPAIHVFGAISPDRRSAFASPVRGWNRSKLAPTSIPPWRQPFRAGP
jgi:hypothetical protein